MLFVFFKVLEETLWSKNLIFVLNCFFYIFIFFSGRDIARLELENVWRLNRLKSAEKKNYLFNKDMMGCNVKIYKLRDQMKHCEKEKFNY